MQNGSHISPLRDCLRIAIIGAGIGGLATALALCQSGFKDVIVYEGARSIGEVGAGIQVAPNFCRVLQHFGILEELKKTAVELKKSSLRRYANNKVIGEPTFVELEKAFGFPTFVVHRADLHIALLKKALALGAVLKTQHRAVKINFPGTALRFSNGSTVEADVIVAADGIKSLVRGQMMEKRGMEDEVVDTGEAAYRVIIPRGLMIQDPELRALIDEPSATRWMAPDSHVMAYPIKAHQAYNVVTDHATVSAVPEDWEHRASKSDMIARFASYAPIVQKLLACAPPNDTLEWKLKVHLPIPEWVEGNVALLGDACHPTLPHLSQGAALAGEDALVIAAALKKATSLSDIPKVLAAYQAVRKPRCDAACDAAAQTGKNLHQPDGPLQEARDAAIAASVKGTGPNPDRWGDVATQDMLYNVDVVGSLEKYWEAHY